MTRPSLNTFLLTILLTRQAVYSSAFVINRPDLLIFKRPNPLHTTKQLAILPSFRRLDVGFPSFHRSNIHKSRLQMAAEDFQESKYTESAWACIAALPKIADYYSSTSIEAPMLLDVMLNPSKHSAGDSAESAKRIAEKVLLKADVDVTKLRQELEVYMSKQPKISSGSSSGESQKMMGRSLSKVVERARENKSLLGVRTSIHESIPMVLHTFLFTLYFYT